VGDDKKGEDEDIKEYGTFKANDDEMFKEAIKRLQCYSFMSIGEDGRTYEMHGLVQLATRKWLKMHGREER
jgi:hypothetical protein